ncbi:MAG: hypothetical protein LBH19_05020 [Dysgonamonadaceae bacterium]|jgi:hypothetical protein|nr:hypothetical protein [Dysgonamonadaceae bacterium]
MRKYFFVFIFFGALFNLQAENNDSTAVAIPQKPRLTLGGYGEIAFSRNFYSDNINRYSHAADYQNAPSHGRFDLPHVVFFAGYEFGKGWRFQSEIEFEHGGTEAAVELEAEEAGELENEIERGGEVVLEQFWIEKTFSKALNLRIGHIIVPVGFTNMNHLPNEFFTVYRPEGENTILPCTWHETGVSVWGKVGKWRYEAALLPALSSEMFSRTGWVKGASASPYEFRVANSYAGALRIDNYSAPGLRLGASGYYGHSFNNSIQPTTAAKYQNVKGQVMIGSFDFHYQNYGVIARGYFDYGHLGDSEIISAYNKNLPKSSPSPRTNVASDAIASGVEVGYDILHRHSCESGNLLAKREKQKLYLFARYEFYDSMYKTAGNIQKDNWCRRQVIFGGINYSPINQVVIKAEYAFRKFQQPYNNEPSVNIGVVYAGMFW